MRYFEITSGVRIPVSGEEQELIDKIGDSMPKADLNEREQELARLMVSRGLLIRSRRDGNIYFTKNKKTLSRN